MTTQNSGLLSAPWGLLQEGKSPGLSGDSVEPRAKHEIYHKFQIFRAKFCGYLWNVLAGIPMKEHPYFSRWTPTQCLSVEGLTLFSGASISIYLSLILFVEAVLACPRRSKRAFNSSIANGVGRMNFLPTRNENALLSQPGNAG